MAFYQGYLKFEFLIQLEVTFFLTNTLKLSYDSLISASKNYFWLLAKIAFLYEVSVSACRVLHSWEQRNDAVHGGDKDIS